ncbi:MAG: class I SAM-dependent methyltransferase [Acidobacteria bacterium]|nr:MAG: class I SAM-dependent methyltransferase [Acidobacteriota bacterium]
MSATTPGRPAPKRPRHALDGALSPSPPDARIRAALAEFYRTNTGYADRQSAHDTRYFRRLLSVMETVIAGANPRVLEIGSGSGGALRAFLDSRPGATAIALEVSGASLQRAGEGAALRPVAGSALEIPLRNESVDAVIAFEVIEHLPDVARAFDEMLRVLRRPGHIVIGLPNHASLWTPIEDRFRGRSRRAFGVERGSGAWRWWRRNAALAWRKRMSRRAEFLYREPILDAVQGGDADAVYYAAPLDLLRYFRNHRADLVMTSTQVRFGPLGRFLPVEMQGSSVMAWRVTEATVRESSTGPA